MVEFLEDMEKWKNGGIESAYNIKHRRFMHQLPDVCRINGDMVESMRNANAPLKAVKMALKLILSGKDIKGFKLGHYTVISYDGKALVIGCHSFPKSEIDRIAKQLNL